jgi:3-oxoacyl-[acyl-carrier protein] reductase
MVDAPNGRLANRIAIVTGGASGFGEGIVRRFVAEGARVAIVDVNLAGAEKLARTLGGDTLALKADVSRDADIERMVAALLAHWGRIDILVNNAGVPQEPQPLEQVSESLFDRIVAVNLKSVYLTAKHVVPHMKRSGRGVVLNVASTGAVRPRPGLAWYNASKGAVVAATSAMAIELAPLKIRVNALNPVAGDTPMLASFMGEDTQAKRDAFIATIPLGRLTVPADIAAAAAFLCSDESSMITGTALEVDGGRCI